jgi:hypothetical protein
VDRLELVREMFQPFLKDGFPNHYHGLIDAFISR